MDRRKSEKIWTPPPDENVPVLGEGEGLFGQVLRELGIKKTDVSRKYRRSRQKVRATHAKSRPRNRAANKRARAARKRNRK